MENFKSFHQIFNLDFLFIEIVCIYPLVSRKWLRVPVMERLNEIIAPGFVSEINEIPLARGWIVIIWIYGHSTNTFKFKLVWQYSGSTLLLVWCIQISTYSHIANRVFLDRNNYYWLLYWKILKYITKQLIGLVMQVRTQFNLHKQEKNLISQFFLMKLAKMDIFKNKFFYPSKKQR